MFTNTDIDYPDHWFLIATASNWANDIDEIISYLRKIIEEKKTLELYHKGWKNTRKKITAEIFDLYIKLVSESKKKIDDLMKKYSDKCQNYFSKNHEN